MHYFLLFLFASFPSSAITLSVRRRRRRQWALARFRWHLHVKGLHPLTLDQLSALLPPLPTHHSQDQAFVSKILKEMVSQKGPSWRCATCWVTMKGSFRCCWKCGEKWYRCKTPAMSRPRRRPQTKLSGSTGGRSRLWHWTLLDGGLLGSRRWPWRSTSQNTKTEKDKTEAELKSLRQLHTTLKAKPASELTDDIKRAMDKAEQFVRKETSRHTPS